MDPRRAETDYLNGYEAGRSTCLIDGSAAARRWLAARPHAGGDPFRAGYARALWDHEDANGVPHDARTQVS